jgi:bacteriorhodopsin
LAPERRENTLAYIQVWSAWFGCGLLVFLLFVMELVFRANLRTPAQLDNAAFIPALLAFVAFGTMLVLRLILHFSRTPDR